MRVLIVDDAAFVRLSLRTILERNGQEVVGEAENGTVAIKKYIELRPDLVTMDITMPDMNGIKALGLIKQIDPNAKVVMVSAMGQQSFVLEAVQAGAKGFVVKPFQEEQVVKALEKM